MRVSERAGRRVRARHMAQVDRQPIWFHDRRRRPNCFTVATFQRYNSPRLTLVMTGDVDLWAKTNFHVTSAWHGGQHVYPGEDLLRGDQEKLGWSRWLVSDYRLPALLRGFCLGLGPGLEEWPNGAFSPAGRMRGSRFARLLLACVRFRGYRLTAIVRVGLKATLQAAGSQGTGKITGHFAALFAASIAGSQSCQQQVPAECGSRLFLAWDTQIQPDARNNPAKLS